MVIVKKGKQSTNHPEVVAKVVSLVSRLSSALGYDDSWRWHLGFQRLKGRRAAETSAELEYRIVRIDFDLLSIIDDEDKELLEKVVIHEVLHVPLWAIHEMIEAFHTGLSFEQVPFYDTLRKCEEATVTFLEHAPMWNEILKGEKT